MALTIDSKVTSMKVQKFLNSSQEQVTKSAQQLASGLRINSARDDSAGLAIAEHMNTLVRGLNAGMRSANDGISMTQTADSGLGKVNQALQRMRELAIQSSNGTRSAVERKNLNIEFMSLNDDISRIASTTTFNGTTVLSNEGSSVNFQVGSSAGDDDTLSVDLVEIEPLSGSIDTLDNSLASISAIDFMMAKISSLRANFGASQGRFEAAINNLQVGVENQSAASGRIMDADYAVEAAARAKSQMLQQAGTAMSSQANVMPQSVAQLLG